MEPAPNIIQNSAKSTNRQTDFNDDIFAKNNVFATSGDEYPAPHNQSTHDSTDSSALIVTAQRL